MGDESADDESADDESADDESAGEESATIYPHLLKNVSFFISFNCLSVLLVKCRQNGGATSIFDGFIDYFNGRLGEKQKNVSFYGVCMYVRPKLTFVSFFLFFFVHLPLRQ